MSVYWRDDFVFLRPTTFSEIPRLSNKTRAIFHGRGGNGEVPVRVRVASPRTDGSSAETALDATCRSSVTACPSTAQQLHRAVHKHRGRIKGGGTGRSSIKDNNWFSVSQLPPTAFTRWPRCCGRRASALLQRLISGVKSGADAFVVAANRRPCPSPLATLSRLVVVVLGPCNIRVTFGVM